VSGVLGIDLSTNAVDLVRLDGETDNARWMRLDLKGGEKLTALERLRRVAGLMPSASFYDDVYLVAVEAPYGTGQAGTLAKLSRVFGAVVACIPQRLEVWEVMPGDWRKELGLGGNASKEECALRVCSLRHQALVRWNVEHWPHAMWEVWPQDALDAWAVAYYARQVNQREVEKTLAAAALTLL